MNLDQMMNQYGLAPAILNIAERVQQVSGKEIDYRPAPDLEVRAQTKMARRDMARHVILFNPKEESHLSHLLAHECGHILRMFEIPAEKRRVPALTAETLRLAKSEIRPEAEFLPQQLRDRMIEMWIQGLTTQLISQPVDMRIEQWINDTYPDLRDQQRRSLASEARMIEASTSPEVQRMTAPTIFRGSYALNYAYWSHIGEIMNRSLEQKFQGSPETITLGKTLFRIWDNDNLSDQEIVSRSADAIKVSEWIVWLDFEDVPESYYKT